KGLQRLRWYCQMCEKQCRDENGFKCHCASESHQRQMAIFAENPERYMEQFSQEFEDAFLSILSRRYGTKKVLANQVYQEIVSDRQHLHMNATKWDTLSEFVMSLGRSGKCKVEEAERGWMVEWIDTSPEALARKAAIMKKERQEMDDEQREQKLLQEQIARAKELQKTANAASESNSDQEATAKGGGVHSEATELKRDEAAQPIKLSWKPLSAQGEAIGLVRVGKISLKPKTTLAKKNPFKTASAGLSKNNGSADNVNNQQSGGALKRPETSVEKIIREELIRKDARQANGAGFTPVRMERRRSRSPVPSQENRINRHGARDKEHRYRNRNRSQSPE
ncbi:hypothetical protein GGI26_003760, partial [Coemansia sp. RSA 1358]